LNPGAGKILCPHPSVQWILCASQRVSWLKKLCSGVCTPLVNFTASIKKIKILWPVESVAVECSWVCCHAFSQWVIVMSRLVLGPFSLLYVLQVLSWEDTKGSFYIVVTLCTDWILRCNYWWETDLSGHYGKWSGLFSFIK